MNVVKQEERHGMEWWKVASVLNLRAVYGELKDNGKLNYNYDGKLWSKATSRVTSEAVSIAWPGVDTAGAFTSYSSTTKW